MKISFKQVLAVGALAVASTSAFADVALPSAGGELTLLVWDQTTNTTYVRGLQVNLDSVMTTAAIQSDVSGGTYVAGESINFSVSATAAQNANLASFLSSASAAGDTVTWAVVGGAVGTTASAVGNSRYVTTTDSSFDLVANNDTITNTQVKTKWNGLAANTNSFNAAIAGSTVGDGSSGVSYAGAISGTAYAWNNTLNNQVAVGSSANFYLVAQSSNTSNQDALVYTLNSLTLNQDGSLTSASAAPVPVPAALWLLGSGLAGLVGIGRRKQVA